MTTATTNTVSGEHTRSRAGAPAAGGGVADQLAARRFVAAVALPPPLGGEVEQARDRVAQLQRRGVDLFLVTPRESARAHVNAINFALHLEQHGIETIATATTWDKTIMALQADTLGAHALGMRSVVCATGDPPQLGDYPNVDGIWDVDSLGLIELLAQLNQGRDCNGLTLATKTAFHIGATVNPGAQDLAAEIARTRAKVQAGAQFLVTRPAYELDALRRILHALGDDRVPTLLHVAPLRSFLEAEYLAHEVPDLMIPDATIRAMEHAGAHAERTGLELATDLLGAARPLVDGVVLSLPGDDAAPLEVLLGAL
ncbi:MAG: methylenetetrahydrofolate reductase [Streptomycetales bacterium]